MYKNKISRYIIYFTLLLSIISCGDIIWDPNPSNSNFDYDGDGLTDDTEKNQKNIDLYSCNWQMDDDDQSIAIGQTNNGSLTFGYNLKDKGHNYYHYYGTDDEDYDDWGTAKLIYVLTHAADQLLERGDGAYYFDTYSDFTGPLQIGDMSLQDGGYWSDHASHQNGLDADLRYVRVDRERLPLNVNLSPEDWDKDATKNVFMAFRDVFQDIDVIFVDQLVKDECDVLYNNVSILDVLESNHDHHFHLRINCPSGQCY